MTAERAWDRPQTGDEAGEGAGPSPSGEFASQRGPMPLASPRPVSTLPEPLTMTALRAIHARNAAAPARTMGRPGPDGWLTARQVCALFGVSYRQLDYWARTGILLPGQAATGSGSTRYYSPANLAALRVLAPLVDLGALRSIRSWHHPDRPHPMAVLVADVEDDPSIADRPLVYVDEHGRARSGPCAGWTVTPLPDPNERHHP